MVKHDRRVDDVPADDPRLASLLNAVAAPSEPGPQPGEGEALAVFRASHPNQRRYSMRHTRTRTRLALTAALGTGLFLTGGVGAAMAGSLPGAAQDTASEMLAAVGVEVPGPDEHSADHPDQRGQSDDRTTEDDATEDETADSTDETADDSTDDATTDSGDDETAGTTETADAADAGKGEDVSKLAGETEAEGVDKGAEISALASDGKSHAGEHGRPDSTDDVRPENPRPGVSDRREAAGARPDDPGEQAPVETPNTGGTGTADDASSEHGDGAASSGTETADDASSGRSSAGSGNRP